jgi:hypothetical protein
VWTTVFEQFAADQSIGSGIHKPHGRTALASADDLVTISEQYVGLMIEGRSTRNSLSHRRRVPAGLFHPGGGASVREKRPYDLAVHACSNFDLVCACLTTEVSAPRVRVLNVCDRNDGLPRCEEIAISIAALHSLEELFNPLSKFDWILHAIETSTGPLNQSLDPPPM